MAAGGRAVPLGITRQLVGEAAFGATGFQYCGNMLGGGLFEDAVMDRAAALASAGESSAWPERDLLILALALACGLRLDEIARLRMADVEGVPPSAIVVRGKGDKERRVPIDPEVGGLIQAYLLAERPETDSRALFVVLKGPSRGRPLTPAGLRTIFRYHRAKAGVPAGHPHALRHTFASHLVMSGADLYTVQKLLGHSRITTPEIYAYLAPDYLRSAMQRLRY